MDICRSNYEYRFKLKGKCDSCGRIFGGEKANNLRDVVPAGLCPFAYYSIVPYWVSFKQDAWFRWRFNKDDVVCQCSRPGGVVFLVKKIKQPSKIEIEAEVISVGSPSCSFGHVKGQVFKIENDILCPALFPSLWVQAEQLAVKGPAEAKLNCALSASADIVCKRDDYE